jgi:AAA family ATP:ADP antiporter
VGANSPRRSGRGADPLLRLEPGELRPLVWAFAYFFCLLSGYYVIRPLREDAGVAGGVENLPWLFSGTLALMLAAVPIYSALTARTPRRVFVPLVYHVFASNLLVFWLLLRGLDGGDAVNVWRAFFVWTSVFNLFAVSVFWSFMADVFSSAQAERLFGFIAAGGTLGALCGSAATSWIAERMAERGWSHVHLLLLPLVLLELAIVSTRHMGAAAARMASLSPEAPRSRDAAEGAPTGGRALDAVTRLAASPYLLGIAAYMFLSTLAATFVYSSQATVFAERFPDRAERTAAFASINLWVQVLTLLVETLVTARLIRRFGVGFALALLPALYAAGFLAVGLSSSAQLLAVIVVLEVLRRTVGYAVASPAREVLFTVVGRGEKYKAKSMIDTAVFRGGDAASAWLFQALREMQLSLQAVALAVLPVCGVWIGVSRFLGSRKRRLAGAAAAIVPGALPAAAAQSPPLGGER